jgi:hypothetical protein
MSRVIDLVAEYRASVAAVTPRYRQRLAELGLIAPANRIGLVGVATVVEGGRGLFEPAPDGPAAIILPVWDRAISDATVILEEPDRLVDLVAWRPSGELPLLTRCGLAEMLGAEALSAAVIASEPLRVFRDPGGWARAGGGDVGVVVIDRSLDVGLLGLKTIVADDVDHGAEIKAALRKLRAKLIGQTPHIRVPTASLGVSA